MRPLLLATALLMLPFAAAADADTRWVVKGRGWGHGVGMSQYGAYGQARAGRDYRTILQHYYRDTEFGNAGGAVRVLLLASVGSSSFRGANRVGGNEIDQSRVYYVDRGGDEIVVRSLKGDQVARSSGVVRVTGPVGEVTVIDKDRAYRDVIEYRPGTSGGVTAVNKVKLENYLRGVVPLESPASWPQDALRAQAVAARSYALASRLTHPVFDLYDTTASQVYGGESAAQPSTNRAVAATAGEVLLHEDVVITAFFHSTSGGHTENNENVFEGAAPLAYTRGVEDPWDKLSPYHRWDPQYYTPRRIGNALGVGRLRRVSNVTRGISGRIIYATVSGSAGSARLHGYDDIRPRLDLRDAPRSIKRITTEASGAR